jgi:RNA polymerase sigma factor (sigma-70 family)
MSMSVSLNDVFMSRRQSLMGIAFRIVRDRQIAEDVAQEAYLRTRKAIELGPIEHIEAFLHQTARNLALDYQRRRKMRARYEDFDADEGDMANVAADIPSTEAVIIEREAIRSFEAALQQLPVRARKAWVLSQLDGWSYAQIADHLGVSRNTVFNDVKLAMGHCHDVLRRLEQT